MFGRTKVKDGTRRIKTNYELDELIRHKNIINNKKKHKDLTGLAIYIEDRKREWQKSV